MPQDLPASIGANVRRLRNGKGLTQERLAENADVSVSLIQQIERGVKDPRASTLVALAGALNTSVDSLVEEAEEVPDRPVGRPTNKGSTSS